RGDRLNPVVLHQGDDRLGFEHVVWTKTKDVVSRNGERGSRAALADDEDVMRVGIGLDHLDLRTRLWPDNDFYAASVEVLDRFKRLCRIVLSIAHKEFETISTVLANRVCFKLFFSNLQRCNRVYPETRPGYMHRSEHANLEHSLRMQLSRLIPSRATNKRDDQSTNDDPEDDANVHKGPNISGL